MSNSGIRIENLTHRFGSKLALDNVSFDVERGKFCALLGPNGAGKSTLFSLMCRLFEAQSGSIQIAGAMLSTEPANALGSIGVVFQQPTLDLDLSVKQNLLYFAGLQGLSGKFAMSAIETSLDRLQMRERINEKVRTLNGGHRRRMEIARALIHNPEVLLLDEPTVGLDAQTRQDITKYAHQLARDEKITIFWATHLVDEVLPEDRLVILHNGQVVKDGVTKQVTGQRKLQSVFSSLTNEERM